MSSHNKLARKLNTWKRRQALATRRVNEIIKKMKRKS